MHSSLGSLPIPWISNCFLFAAAIKIKNYLLFSRTWCSSVAPCWPTSWRTEMTSGWAKQSIKRKVWLFSRSWDRSRPTKVVLIPINYLNFVFYRWWFYTNCVSSWFQFLYYFLPLKNRIYIIYWLLKKIDRAIEIQHLNCLNGLYFHYFALLREKL